MKSWVDGDASSDEASCFFVSAYSARRIDAACLRSAILSSSVWTFNSVNSLKVIFSHKDWRRLLAEVIILMPVVTPEAHPDTWILKSGVIREENTEKTLQASYVTM